MPLITWDSILADARSGAYALKTALVIKAVRTSPPFAFDPAPFHSIESAADAAKEYARLAVSFAREAGTLPAEPWGA